MGCSLPVQFWWRVELVKFGGSSLLWERSPFRSRSGLFVARNASVGGLSGRMLWLLTCGLGRFRALRTPIPLFSPFDLWVPKDWVVVFIVFFGVPVVNQ
jgi:hypothetical protein